MSRDACIHGKYRHMETCSICDARADWSEAVLELRLETENMVSALEARVQYLEAFVGHQVRAAQERRP